MKTKTPYIESYIYNIPKNTYRINTLTTKVLKLLPPLNTVLDFGAGVGHLTSKIIQHKNVTKINAIDISEKLVLYMQERFQKNKKVVPSTNSLNDFSINTFDTIYALDVLEHIQNDSKIIQDMERILKPQGKILFVVPAHQLLYSDFDRKIGHYRRYEKIDLLNKLRQSGLIIERIQYWNTLGYVIISMLKKMKLKRPVSYSHKKSTFQYITNTLLSTWFRFVENNINPPIGLSIIAICRKNHKIS